MTHTKETQKEIAATILSQLGGAGRLVAMTGAKNFCSHPEGALSFKIGRNAKGVNYCKITLTSDDLYTVEFKRVTVKKITDKGTTVGAYNDMLHDLFEQATGMYLTLGRVVFK